MCEEECRADTPKEKLSSITRRKLIKNIATVPLATILAHPELAKASAERLHDISVIRNNGQVRGALATPEDKTRKYPAILMIHEWWGLNDQIKSVAADLSSLGYIVFAIDLYNGEVATTRAKAKKLTQDLNPEQAARSIGASFSLLKEMENCNGKLGSIGWCFGGGWSLQAAILNPIDACVIYYGRVNVSSVELQSLQAPVLGHFGKKDKFINEKMVKGFEKNMKSLANSNYKNYWYDADHAFANPTSARYDKGNAALAWSRTLKFFNKNLNS